MVLHMYSSSKASIIGVTLDILPKDSVMEGLVGFRVKGIAAKNLELVSGVFCSLPLSLSSPLTWSSSSLSSQSNDVGNSFGHSFPSGIHIMQFLEYSVSFIGALGEV